MGSVLLLPAWANNDTGQAEGDFFVSCGGLLVWQRQNSGVRSPQRAGTPASRPSSFFILHVAEPLGVGPSSPSNTSVVILAYRACGHGGGFAVNNEHFQVFILQVSDG